MISVIMPVYNAEKYLARCMDSVLSQTYKNFELICVNDGSTDNSLLLLKEYSQRDSRIRIVNQKNGGVSCARQAGIEVAGGGWFIHVDPDDWVEPDWLEAMIVNAEKTDSDMVICDFDRIYSDKIVCCKQEPTSLNCSDVIEDLLEKKLWGTSWNKLIKAVCFEKYNIKFHQDMNLWEDLYVICKLLLNDIKVSYVPQVLYHYDSCTNDNSIVRYRKDEHVRSAMIFINDFEPVLSDDKYFNGWFILKSRIKAWIFMIKNSKYDIKETYSEINDRYIESVKKKGFWSTEFLIAMSICGHSKIAHLIYDIKKHIEKWTL